MDHSGHAKHNFFYSCPEQKQFLFLFYLIPLLKTTALATGGYREGTLSKIKYRYVKEDIEETESPYTSMSKRKLPKANMAITTLFLVLKP